MKQQKDEVVNGGLVDKEKRETLKKLGTLAYAAPATILLVTADRATAQSVCTFTVVNNITGCQGQTPGIDVSGSVSGSIGSVANGVSQEFGGSPGETITVATADNSTAPWELNGTPVSTGTSYSFPLDPCGTISVSGEEVPC